MIRLAGIEKHYGGRRRVGPLDLELGPRETLSILGPSGCGKTTLLRLVAGLEEPEAGEIVLEGVSASRPGFLIPPRARHVGFVFQAPALWPHLSVHENIAFGLARTRGQEATTRVERLLEAAGIPGFGTRRPEELSGGEAQRVSILRALAPSPRLLLLDEPVSPLDPETAAILLALVRSEADATGASILHVTHDEAEAISLKGRRIRMTSEGRISGEDPPS